MAFSFGNSNPTQSLFGSANNTNSTNKPGLFGSSIATGQQQRQESQGGLFGAQNSQQQQQGVGLFGSTAQGPQAGGLFGSTQIQQQPQQSGGLFGRPPTQQSQQTGGLFGSSQARQGNTSTLSFGQSQPQQQFGASSFSSTLGSGSQYQQPYGLVPRQKSVPERMDTVVKQWKSDSPDCVFQHYFYNKVPEEQAVYFRPGPNENEAKWEEALSKKPGKGYVPVLCTGFAQLGLRIQLQAHAVRELNRKAHEINNSLTVMLQNHDLVTTIRAAEAKRKHIVLSQRCMTLARKVQVLRNRGYAMGSDEEELKKKLVALDRAVFDPSLNGRAEEIWARMVAVRERARALEDETDRIGQGKTKGQPDTIDEDTAKKAAKILDDYAKQLQHLQKEIESITKDLEAWQGSNKAVPNGLGSRR